MERIAGEDQGNECGAGKHGAPPETARGADSLRTRVPLGARSEKSNPDSVRSG
jgi:hypothetical protein